MSSFMCLDSVSNMCNVPPKFYQLCRLCLSEDAEAQSLFDNTASERNVPRKIMTCLSIMVSRWISYKKTTRGKWSKLRINLSECVIYSRVYLCSWLSNLPDYFDNNVQLHLKFILRLFLSITSVTKKNVFFCTSAWVYRCIVFDCSSPDTFIIHFFWFPPEFTWTIVLC